MPNARFTSGGGGAIKHYERRGGVIRVTGTKDPGATLTVTSRPSGRQTAVPAGAPDNWDITVAADPNDTELYLDGPGDKEDTQQVQITNVVVQQNAGGAG